MDAEAGSVIYDSHGVTLTVKGDRLVKSGPEVRLQEAHNLEYVQGKVACPKLYGYHQKGDEVFIEMEYIQGKTLRNIWPTLDDEQRQRVTDNIIREMRRLHEVSNGDSRTCGINDTVIHGLLRDDGVRFEDENALNEYLVSFAKEHAKMEYLLRSLLPVNTRFCLNHGNLYSRNIVVKDDMSVVFINWGTMGFLPEYWDAMMMFTVTPVDAKLSYDAAAAFDVSDSTLAAFHTIWAMLF
ncbi:hypothetical protein IWQ57_002039 [Coemansia nantahalensis]|uniref:Uncharacterized protein n=1 Tax=Coemansia nantahalensis TaxID=2789366 RepID=A0ACC1K2B9_9FUNG|nr:hypothetical protein IWQ57_002039 [Coemansia nantahalensis]